MADATTHPSYASVNGLEMYYEVHGSGQPLVLLHGAFGATSAFAQLLPTLTATRQIIALDLQGHGRTADIDWPFSYEGMADDTAAFMRELGIESADIFGYSMGGGVALQLAIRHPNLVRKLVVASATYNSGGMYPEVLEGIATITPEAFAGSPMEAEYLKLAPKPDAWPTLIDKIKQLDATVQDWPAQDIQAIRAPTLLIIGDSDVVRPEHAVELFRLLGGGVAGDLSGLPDAQLAVLPGTTHITVMDKTDLLLAVILPFLDAPMRDAA
jgi:pimeloyl-ACP methyl ester carboxylesterase